MILGGQGEKLRGSRDPGEDLAAQRSGDTAPQLPPCFQADCSRIPPFGLCCRGGPASSCLLAPWCTARLLPWWTLLLSHSPGTLLSPGTGTPLGRCMSHSLTLLWCLLKWQVVSEAFRVTGPQGSMPPCAQCPVQPPAHVHAQHTHTHTHESLPLAL